MPGRLNPDLVTGALDSAIDALAFSENLTGILGLFASFSGMGWEEAQDQHPEGHRRFNPVLDLYWPEYQKTVRTLADAYDLVAGDWVMDRPPDLDRSAASLLEAVLRKLASYEAHVAEARRTLGPHPVGAVPIACFARLHVPRLLTRDLVGPLRCEAMAVLTRRGDHPPIPNLLGKHRKSAAELIQAWASEEAKEHLPFGWAEMTDPDRLTAVGNSARIVPAPRSCLPVWDTGTRTLRFAGLTLADFNAKQAPNQEKILAAFEEDEWQPVVTVSGLTGKALSDAIRLLNKRLDPPVIEFHGGGTGDNVRWLPAGARPVEPRHAAAALAGPTESGPGLVANPISNNR